MDPTIQTFCCHHSNETIIANLLMQHFNTDAYNGVCMFSSALGIIGAIYQILPRAEFSTRHRWLSFTARGRSIIICLAIADLLASLGVFIRSTLWLCMKNIIPSIEDDNSVMFCSISSALIQYFYTATWIWTLCYAIDMRFILTEKESKIVYYHLVAWSFPALLTTAGLALLYLPDANCHMVSSLESTILTILPNYLATYVPILIVMVANPWLYCRSTRDMEYILTSASGQFTSRERAILDAIKIKFALINIVFYICWLPNLLNSILLWALWFHLPSNLIIILWYIMAFMNPLQALLNCLVYRRWVSGSERIILPWRKIENSEMLRTSQRRTNTVESEQSTVHEEILPLLQNAQSINGYKRYAS